jgi:hypothetical protein
MRERKKKIQAKKWSVTGFWFADVLAVAPVFHG